MYDFGKIYDFYEVRSIVYAKNKLLKLIFY